MAHRVGEHGWRALAAVVFAGVLALAVGGCVSATSKDPALVQQNAVLSETAPPDATGSAIPLTPAVLVEEEPAKAHPAAVASVGPASGEYPSLNTAPTEPDSKLLTPEEKAKVIAELEALAKSQGAPSVKPATQARAECEKNAALALTPEARLKLEREDRKC